MTETEIFKLKRYSLHSSDYSGDYFIISPGKNSKMTLFCGIKPAKANIANIPEYLLKLKKFADRYNAYIICLNEENIAGYEHIESAIFHAKRSWFEQKPISNSFEMEVLLYAAGTRQCSQATAFGFQKGRNSLYVSVCIIEDYNSTKDIIENKKNNVSSLKNTGIFEKVDTVFNELKDCFEFSENKEKMNHALDNCINQKLSDKKIKKLMKLFEISEEERESIGTKRFSELVLERVALLDVSK
jgi:KEOPS complex subunit Cgi121